MDGTAHLRGRQPDGRLAVQCAFQQLVTENVVEVLGHDSLLLNTAVVLNGEDDWIVRYLDEGQEEVQRCREGARLKYNLGEHCHRRKVTRLPP